MPPISVAGLGPALSRLIASSSLRDRVGAGEARLAFPDLPADAVPALEAMAALLDASLLRGVPGEEVHRLIDLSTPLHFVNGEVMVREGDTGDRFYLVAMGSASVTVRTRWGGEMDIANIGPGDFFGELALLYNIPRTASVQARDAVETWSLDPAAFQRLLAVAPTIATRITEEAQRRISG
ncbi:MAG: cyclic nucleotide-binding domain-containing protein [Chloroflexi bacterium]|nr:cyclic nucleotide-binding domain-containing protein [Chloroflexota bacterium]